MSDWEDNYDRWKLDCPDDPADPDGGDVCRKCDGDGIVPCEECDATGKVKDEDTGEIYDCPNCRGSGVVTCKCKF